jgi:integrase
MKVELEYLFRDRDRHGNVRFYVRLQGEKSVKIRLRAEPGTAAFLTEYRAALAKLKGDKAKSKPKTPVHTLRWLVAEFEKSPAFTSVTFREQRGRHNLVEAALNEPYRPGMAPLIGDCELRFFDGKLARILRDRKASTPSASHHRVAWLRRIFNWGLEERPDHVKTNPFIGLEAIKHKSQHHHIWSEDELNTFQAFHKVGTQARLALDLMLYTGARRGDVVKLGPKNLGPVVNPMTGVKETWIKFKPSKTSHSTDVDVHIPVVPPLRDSLAATQPQGFVAFLLNSYAKPHASGDSFANWFKDRVLEAGLPGHCGCHGLRTVASIRCAEAGMSAKQIMAVMGWTTLAIAQKYVDMAEKKKLVAGSVHGLVPKGSI